MALSIQAYRREKILCILMILVSVAFLKTSYGYDAESSVFPRFLSWFLLALSLMNIVRTKRLSEQVRGHEATGGFARWCALLFIIFAPCGIYIIAIDLIGYYLATALYLSTLMIWLSREEGTYHLKAIFLASGGFILLVWLLFGVFLGTHLPVGSIFSPFFS